MLAAVRPALSDAGVQMLSGTYCSGEDAWSRSRAFRIAWRAITMHLALTNAIATIKPSQVWIERSCVIFGHAGSSRSGLREGCHGEETRIQKAVLLSCRCRDQKQLRAALKLDAFIQTRALGCLVASNRGSWVRWAYEKRESACWRAQAMASADEIACRISSRDQHQ
jgi:hypothetical protein